MVGDDRRPLGGRAAPGMPGSAAAVLRMARLSEAEARDLALFMAPGRLQVARRLMLSGLSWTSQPDGPSANNDN